MPTRRWSTRPRPVLANSRLQAERRNKLSDLAVTTEQRDNFNTTADTAAASLRRDEANLDEAKLNLERTEVRSPVNGWITNLLTQRGDYATTGMRAFVGRRCGFVLGRRLFRGKRWSSRSRSATRRASG